MPDKLVIVGLDGATFDYLDPLLDQGKLPHLQALLDQGVHGALESVRPPISCPAWFCYSTGKNPGKLGIFGWRNFDPATKTDRFNDYKQLTEPEIWDVMGRAGLKSAVINLPTHFPPKRIDGYMVSGMQAEHHEVFTHPPELSARLREEIGYQVAPDHKMLWDYETGYQQALDLFETRLDAARMLLDEVDLLHVTIFHIDEIQHNAWGTKDLAAAWQHIDGLLGAFLEDLPGGTDTLLMSDHGFVERSLKFQLNTWLEEQGYLATRANTTGKALRRLGITRKRAERLLKRTGLLGLAKAVVPRSLQHAVKEEDGTTSNQRRLVEVDWEATQAFASTNFTLHVLDPDKVEEIIQGLREAKSPEGHEVFAEVLRADEVLHGDRMEQAPQILLLPNAGLGTGDAIGKPLWEQHPSTAGGHALDGIFVASGPSFRQGEEIRGAQLIDLAPTILHHQGLPVPKDMDGQVLDIFTDDREVQYTSMAADIGTFSEQELRKVEDRLRGLGYLE